MSAWEVRVEGDRPFEFFDGFGQEGCLAVSATEDDVELRSVAEAGEHSFVNLLGGRELVLLEVRESERVGDVVVVRRESERRLKLCD